MNGNQLISGRYEGTLSNSKLELRIDVDEPRPMNKISGDIFKIDGKTVSYFGSFIVHVSRPPVNPASPTLTLKARVEKFTHDELDKIVKVTIPINTPQGHQGDATVEFINRSSGDVESAYTARFISSFFREISLEQIIQDGIIPFDKYNTGSLPLPQGNAPKEISLISAYEDAGVKVTKSNVINTIKGKGDEIWTDSELNKAIKDNFELIKNQQNQMGWKAWSFATTQHICSDNAGVMFDISDDNQRQGFAVFYKAIAKGKFTPSELSRFLLFTNVHELGHCFNLLHSFEKNRSSSLTWMNYPQNYTGGAGIPGGADGTARAIDFWKQFAFQFDIDELTHIRHGFYQNVIMGGSVYDEFHSALTLSEAGEFDKPLEGDSGLDLRLESKRYYNFGEPVVVDIKISTTDPKGADTIKRIHPKFGFVRFAIQKPNGDVFEYKPMIDNFIIPSFEKLEKDKLALYDSAYIGYGKDGFYFDQIGNYSISGLFYAPDGSKVVSNPITIRVKPPITATDDKIAELYFGDEQGKLFYLLGSDSDFLKNGNNAFKLVVDKYKNHPMSIYAHLVLGNNKAREFKSIDFKTGKITYRKTKPESAIKYLNKVKNASKKMNGIDNITLNMVYTVLTNMYKKEGDNKSAKAEAEKMLKIFKAKKLNRFVTEYIKKQAKELVKECR